MRITIDTGGFRRAFHKFVDETGSDYNRTALRVSRTYMRNVLAITPPGDGKQGGERAALTKDDQRRGESAIIADLNRLFVPVDLQRNHPERWPNVQGIHRAAFIVGKRPGKRIKQPNGRGQFYYVDRRKLRALQRALFKRVGRLASYWLAAAAAIKTPGIPAWVRQHGVHGRARHLDKPGRFYLEGINPIVPGDLGPELARRLDYATRYTTASLERQLKAILDKRAARFNQQQRAA